MPCCSRGTQHPRAGQRAPAGWHTEPVGTNHFGERIAGMYDDDSSVMFAPAVVGPTVDFLADLARGGPALELGIGTGRIALPLARGESRSRGSTCRRTWWPA